jgi:sugar phosphate isomerase/epimerase
MTAEQLLDKAQQLGARVVQIADNLPLDRLPNSEIDMLVRRAGQLGIDLEVGTCGIRPEHLRTYLGLAIRLKSPLVRVVLDTEDRHTSPPEAVEALRTVVPDFERAGVVLAIENHDRFKAATLSAMLERIDSGSVGVCLDTANSIGCPEGLETLVAVLGRRVVNLHIKDYAIFRPPHRKGFVVEGRPAGRGQLDIPWLLEQLRAQGRDPNAILELWPPPQATAAESVANEDAWATESIRYLRRLIPG